MTCKLAEIKLGTAALSDIEPKFLLIYTAPLLRPSFRRGVLDAICYPKGQLIPYSYRRVHFHPDLFTRPSITSAARPPQDPFDPTALRGKEAVIVFVDISEGQKVNYFPLRRVTIYDAAPEVGAANPPSDQEKIKLVLQLQDYIRYPEAPHKENPWHETVKTFDYSRKIGSNGNPSYFVINADDKFEKSSNSASLAWENLVRAVAESTAFRNATFLRLGHLQRYGAKKEISRLSKADRLIYRLKPAEIYRIDLSVFEKSARSDTGDSATVEILASGTDSLYVDQPHQSFVSGGEERSALIVCKRSIETVTTTLSVRTQRKGDTENLVNSPSPTLFVRIAAPRVRLFAFMALVYVGGLLLAFDAALLRECWVAYPLLWAFSLKAIGAAALTIAAFMAYRKLPSGHG
jgi:hypothetical protein